MRSKTSWHRGIVCRRICIGVAALWLTCASRALAQGNTDDVARGAARAAGYEGVQAFQNGDFATAVSKLGRAFEVARVPTLGLWYARALTKTGKLVEASERYGEVVRLEVTEGRVKEQQKAQSEATEELTALLPRIPRITISLVGATMDCRVSVDGNPLPRKLMDLAAPTNPGKHLIRATQGVQVVEQSITLEEGELKQITLQLAQAQAAPPATATTVQFAPSTTAAPTQPPAVPTKVPIAVVATGLAAAPSEPTSSIQKTLGWISLGIGGAATVTGAVTGLLVLVKHRQLDESSNCDSTASECLRIEHDLVTRHNQLRTVSTVGFVAGAVGLGAGLGWLLTAPKPKEAAVRAWLGVGSVGAQGSF